MNSAISWLYAQFVGQPEPGAQSCYLCGAACTEQRRVAKGLADTFNSHYLAACPSSPYLCAACAWYFDSKAAHPDFRKMSLIVARDSWQQWPREQMAADIERWLSDGLEADPYLVVT